MSERTVSVQIKADIARFNEGMRKVAEAYAQAVRKAMPALHRFAHAVQPHRDRAHRRRCSVCNPKANPQPLCIDGRAYRARRRNRSKR